MSSVKAKYEHRIQGNDIELVVSFDNEETGLLSALFNAEFDSFFDWIYGNVEDSLNNSKHLEIAGNVCKLEISEDYTYIYNMLDDDEDIFLKIDTPTLKELMLEWKKEFDACSSHSKS